MTEKPKTGKQRKKYRVITAVIAALLTIFVFAACFLTIKSVNDFIYMTQRRQDALDVAEAGGFKAVNEKITAMSDEKDRLNNELSSKLEEKDSAVEKMNTVQTRYNEIVSENEKLSKTSDPSKYDELSREYDDLEKKYNSLKEEYDKLNSSEDNNNTDDDIPVSGGGTRVAYLTFDDGPSAYTGKILETLRTYNVKATFFVNGYRGYHSMYPRIVEEGHTLGNHTYSHEWGSVYKNPAAFKNEVVKLNEIIEEKTGVTPTVFRFPGGSNTTRCGGSVSTDPEWQRTEDDPYKMFSAAVNVLNDLNMEYFDWNVSARDAEGIKYTTSQLVNNVLSEAGNKNTIIVLMHEKEMTANALSSIIEALRDKGFVFRPITTDAPTFQFLKQ